MKDKKTILMGGAAVALLALSFFIVYLVLNFFFDFGPESAKKDEVKEPTSTVVSKDPKVSASNFLNVVGNIGDLSEVNQDYFNEIQLETNSDRRMSSYEKALEMILEDSPLVDERTLNAIKEESIEFFVFYKMSDVKVSEPLNERKINVFRNAVGNQEFNAVDVYANFTSSKHTFYWPTDATGESIITEAMVQDKFEDVKITLIESDGLWFIYDVENAEDLINVRFSTWKGVGKDNVSVEEVILNEYSLNYNVETEWERGVNFEKQKRN